MDQPANRTALVNVLKTARQQKGLSIRQAAAVAKVAPSTVQGWMDGRHLPTPALTGNFLELVAALDLIETGQDRDGWIAALAAMRGVNINDDPPYVGLRPYSSDDAGLYFGRERAFEELVRDCDRGGREGLITVILIGDSGAGKSSLLAAGLVGRAVKPGGQLAGLTPCWVEPAALPNFEPPDEPCLILVDQFEEAQKLPDDQQRAIFDALAALPGHATVVVALTADAFGFAMRDDRFAAHLDTHVRIASLKDDEYRKIIEEPAKLHGREVSPALTTLILQDMKQYGEPTAGTVLPLLSSVLRRCWDTSRGDEIRTGDYLRTGGLWAAVDGAAEEVYSGVEPERQQLVRRLMLSLVRVEGTQILRRRIPIETLDEDLLEIADRFVRARLLVRHEEQLAIAHDALLRRWDRLRTWADEESASLLIGRRIHMATQVWDEGGRAVEALLPAEAELWDAWSQHDGAPLLSLHEREFIAASLEQAQSDAVEQRKTIRTLRNRQVVAIVALCVALVMAGSAFFASARSNMFRDEAEAATRSAQARQVALVANDVREITPNIAGQLSVASMKLDDSVETRSAVVKSAGMPMPARAIGPAGNTMVGLTSTGGIVRADSSGTVSLWRDGNLDNPPATFSSGGSQLFALAVTRLGDRDVIFVGGQKSASIWDITEEPVLLGEFGQDTVSYSAAWEGDTVVFGTLEGQIRRVDLSDQKAPRELPTIQLDEPVAVSAVAAVGDLILAGGREGFIDVYSAASGEKLAAHEVTGTVQALDVSPARDEIVLGTRGRMAGLWRVVPNDIEPTLSWELPASIHAVEHLGDRVLVGGDFAEVRAYLRDATLQRSWPERTVAVSLASRGDTMLVGATEGAVTSWDSRASDSFTQLGEGRLFDVIRGGDAVLIGSSQGPRIFDRYEGRWRSLPLQTGEAGVPLNAYYALSEDGQSLVSQTRDGRLLTFRREGEAYRQVDEMAMPDTLSDLQLSPSGEFLALGAAGLVGYRLYHWDGASWAEFGAVEGWPNGSAFSGDGLFVAMGVDGQDFTVWETSGSAPRQLARVATVNDEVPVDFAGATGQVAIGDSAGDVTVYSLADPATPTVIERLRDARSSITQLSFSGDGSRLLASTGEGLVWVWRLDEDEARLELRLDPDSTAVQGVAELDGWVVMSLTDGRTTAWPLDSSGAVSELCERFGTPLSADEWERLVPGVTFINGCG